MSIRLVTGAIGSGKTSLVVNMLLEDKDLQNRPIYVDGIEDLLIPHEEIPEGCSPKNWHEWMPDGAILIVDEAQRYWRTRHSSGQVPPELASLEISRHSANDFIFITQHPRQIDAHIKSLVTQHLHISMTQLGVRKLSEWPSCKNPDSKADMKEAIKKPFKLKKTVFGQYKSAVEHVELKRGRRKIVYIFPILLIFFVCAIIYSVYYIWGFNEKISGDKPKDNATSETKMEYQDKKLSIMNADSAQQVVGTQAIDYVVRIPEKPETKPLYDNVRTVVNMEYPEVCISSKNKCKCYTNQATVIDEIPDVFCRKFSEDGVFNPYKPSISIVNETSNQSPVQTGSHS